MQPVHSGMDYVAMVAIHVAMVTGSGANIKWWTALAYQQFKYLLSKKICIRFSTIYMSAELVLPAAQQ